MTAGSFAARLLQNQIKVSNIYFTNIAGPLSLYSHSRKPQHKSGQSLTGQSVSHIRCLLPFLFYVNPSSVLRLS